LTLTWSANGKIEKVETQIPELGKFKLTSRPEGSLYLVSKDNDKIKTTLIDKNGLLPTQNISN